MRLLIAITLSGIKSKLDKELITAAVIKLIEIVVLVSLTLSRVTTLSNNGVNSKIMYIYGKFMKYVTWAFYLSNLFSLNDISVGQVESILYEGQGL